MRINKAAIKYFLCLFYLCLFSFNLNAEAQENEPDFRGESASFSPELKISPFLAFHEIGWNMLHSITYNYGFNFIGAGLGTWGFIETGLDWELRNVAYDYPRLAKSGLPFLFAGYFVPVITPIPLYVAGRYFSDTKMQLTAVALVQALALAQTIHLSFKMITGRAVPGVISDVFFEPMQTRDTRTKDFSGEFNWFTFNFYDGWPSGHVLSAFSAAAVIAEIYDEKPLLKFGVYAYAVAMCFGVAVNAHWASDSFAGALIGYAIGKTVGKSFNKLVGKNPENNKVSPCFSGNTIGVIIRM